MNDFKQDACPVSTSYDKSLASSKPYQSNSFALKTAILKLPCICPFKLSSNKTNFDKMIRFFININLTNLAAIFDT